MLNLENESRMRNEIRAIIEQKEAFRKSIENACGWPELKADHIVHGRKVYAMYLPGWIGTWREGKFVLIGPESEEPGDDAFFDNQNEACSAGYKRNGTTPFMVKKVMGLQELKKYGIDGEPIDMSESRYFMALMRSPISLN